MRLAIVGSTCLEGNESVRALIVEIIREYQARLTRGEDFVVVSGGAIGVDRMAERAAKGHSISTAIFEPGDAIWDGRHGFKVRNLRIARYCTDIVRIVCIHRKTYGSGWTRDRARELGKRCREFRVDGDHIEEVR